MNLLNKRGYDPHDEALMERQDHAEALGVAKPPNDPACVADYFAALAGIEDGGETAIAEMRSLLEDPRAFFDHESCDPGCPGWALMNDREIQRCDSCEVFETDDAAIEYVRRLAGRERVRLIRRARQRAKRRSVNHVKHCSGCNECQGDRE